MNTAREQKRLAKKLKKLSPRYKQNVYISHTCTNVYESITVMLIDGEGKAVVHAHGGTLGITLASFWKSLHQYASQ
jgi:hypothetical protein